MGLPFFQLKPTRQHLYGASSAQADMEPVLRQLQESSGGSVVLNVDLSGAESITSSYLRGTMLWALLCGQADAKQTPATSLADPWALRPLPIFPVLTGCSREVAEEAHDFFAQRNLPVLLVTEGSPPDIEKAAILGRLDSFLFSTVRSLCMLGEGTAAQLAEASDERITVNGWSNRLADLFALRLVTRQRSGKYWIYSPLAKKYTSWA